MPDQKKAWITTKEAAGILTTHSGHQVSEAYVRRLGNIGKIEYDQIDQRTRLYKRSDVEKYKVGVRGDGSVRRAIRASKKEAIA